MKALIKKIWTLPVWMPALLLAAVLWSAPVLGNAQPDDLNLQKRYDLAKIYYHNLQNKETLHNSRDDWEQGIRFFRQIYLANPKHELARSSLFMMGRMYQEMYVVFSNPLDLGEAITYYQDVAFLSPDSRLADDAIFVLGRIYLIDKQDKKRAAETFSIITSQYQDGDMFRAAVEELQKLNGKSGNGAPVAKKNEEFAQVLPILFWSSNNYTRIVIKTTAPVPFKEYLLEKSGNQPRRLYLDFSNSRIGPMASAPVPIQDGLLKRVRGGQFSADTVRVVLDIESISKYKIFTLQDPFRVVIDVMGQEQGQEPHEQKKRVPVLTAAQVKQRVSSGTAEKHKPPPIRPEIESQPPISLAQQLGLGINSIVIDPGHGGKDPGAIAENGLKEKDLVLKIGKMLSDKLRQQLGVTIIMTRDTDVFIPLEERTAIANTNRGDIFVSLHINSAPTPNVLGVETYTLNLTRDESAMKLAAFENATSTSKMSDLEDILSGILTYTKVDESTKLAESMQMSMANGLELKNLGVKQAPFYVLIGAQMPAVLTEVTFMSNPKEARRLQRESYLDAIAEQIATGIVDYVRKEHLATARE